MNLLDILRPEAIKVPLDASDKRGAIEELVDLLTEAELVRDGKALKDAVWSREVQRSTGIGEGLAIPHAKCDCAFEHQLYLAAGRPAEPMEFQSADGNPARLIFLLATPTDMNPEHIQALGKISRIMSDPAFRERTYATQTAEELYELIREAEAAQAV